MFGPNIFSDLHCFFGIDVKCFHEPTGFVCADRHKQNLDGSEFLSYFLITV